MATSPSASRDAVRAVVPKMIDLTEKVLFGDVWERPNLSKRDRSLITVAGSAGIGLFFAFWSWVGFEAAPNYAEEARDPVKVIPIALILVPSVVYARLTRLPLASMAT